MTSTGTLRDEELCDCPDPTDELAVMERGGLPTDHSGHRERLRARLMDSGGKALTDYELLELLLTYGIPRIDTKPLAKRLLAAQGSLHGVLHASTEELQKTDGLGPNSAVFLKVVQAFLRRSLECEMQEKESLRGPEEVFNFVRLHLGRASRETVMALYLDDAKRLLHHAEVGKGTVDRTAFYPREIIAPALRCGATGIILVHNHPRGEAIPSEADLSLTRKLDALADELGLKLLDHMIVAGQRAYCIKSGRLYE